MQGYKCLIRPLLESASSSRGLHQEYLRDKLENMQSGEGDKQELICHIKVIKWHEYMLCAEVTITGRQKKEQQIDVYIQMSQ